MKSNSIECPNRCGGRMALNKRSMTWKHVGVHRANCILKKFEPMSHMAMNGLLRGIERVQNEQNQEVLNDQQFTSGDNVIPVDFKNKKKL
jgi:hypothetical protein